MGLLINDTALSENIKYSLSNFKSSSYEFKTITENINKVSSKIKIGEGGLGIAISDTVFAWNLNKTMKNLNTGTALFSENMEALRYNFFFKSYFTNKEKKRKESNK